MKIVVAYKVVPDDQDIQVKDDSTLDYSRCKPVLSTYDLNALAAASELAAKVPGSTVTAITVGGQDANSSNMKKAVLSRGADEVYVCAGEEWSGLDSHSTAEALAGILAEIEGWDLVICGDGSADWYAQQVDVQLAARLGVPMVNGITKIDTSADSVTVARLLEDSVQQLKVPLPAVVSVTPDAAEPHIPTMKEILSARKKPMHEVELSHSIGPAVEVVSCKAANQQKRKEQIYRSSDADGVANFVEALKAAL